MKVYNVQFQFFQLLLKITCNKFVLFVNLEY